MYVCIYISFKKNLKKSKKYCCFLFIYIFLFLFYISLYFYTVEIQIQYLKYPVFFKTSKIFKDKNVFFAFEKF